MDEIWTYKRMNVTQISSSYQCVCQMCFQHMTSMHEMDELWMNEFCMIFISKLWNVKFVL
jgi:hypothetical protein